MEGPTFILFDLTSQAAFSGFLNVHSKRLLIQNKLLLTLREITKVKNIEKKFQQTMIKNILCTREKGGRLKIFCRPKLFETLPDSNFE